MRPATSPLVPDAVEGHQRRIHVQGQANTHNLMEAPPLQKPRCQTRRCILAKVVLNRAVPSKAPLQDLVLDPPTGAPTMNDRAENSGPDRSKKTMTVEDANDGDRHRRQYALTRGLPPTTHDRIASRRRQIEPA